MAAETRVIVQLARDGMVDHRLSVDPPLSVESGLVVLQHELPDSVGRLGPPEGGEVVLSMLSPEALTREPGEVADAIRQAADPHQPPVIIVEAAEELREEELAVLANAAERAHRVVILRIMADA